MEAVVLQSRTTRHGEPVRTVLIRVLGGGQPCLGDLVCILADWWQTPVRDLQIPQRNLTALEVGHAAMVRRIARLR